MQQSDAYLTAPIAFDHRDFQEVAVWISDQIAVARFYIQRQSVGDDLVGYHADDARSAAHAGETQPLSAEVRQADRVTHGRCEVVRQRGRGEERLPRLGD